MNTEEFLKTHPLALDKVHMLQYLERVSDKFSIEPQPKGRSKIECRFDCGAYKGEEVLTFRVATLNPIQIAAKLMNLTSGHHFSFKDGEEHVLQDMERSLSKKAA